jgi:hypothetical protein
MELDIVSLIRDIGFPAAIALYTLITLNKSTKENTAMVKENTRVLSILCTKIGCDDMVNTGNEK